LIAFALLLRTVRSFRRDLDVAAAYKRGRISGVMLLERPGDGLLTLDGLPRLSPFVSFSIKVLMIAPTLAMLNSYVWGVILASAEGWTADEGIAFIQYTLSMLLNPFSNVSPGTVVGKIISLVAGLYAFLFINCILGIASATRLITKCDELLPASSLGFLGAMLFVIPVMLAILSIIVGVIVALLEEWPLDDGIIETLCIMVSGGNLSLASVPIKSLAGFFAAFLIMMWIITMSGAIIGIVGGHPAMEELLRFLEGEEPVHEKVAYGAAKFGAKKIETCIEEGVEGSVKLTAEVEVQTDPVLLIDQVEEI